MTIEQEIKLQHAILKFLELDPYDMVDADLDCFSAYVIIKTPKDFKDMWEQGYGESFEEWQHDVYLDYLQSMGAKRAVEALKKLHTAELTRLVSQAVEQEVLS